MKKEVPTGPQLSGKSICLQISGLRFEPQWHLPLPLPNFDQKKEKKRLFQFVRKDTQQYHVCFFCYQSLLEAIWLSIYVWQECSVIGYRYLKVVVELFVHLLLQGMKIPTYNNELLNLAEDLARRLLPAFDTPSGVPTRLSLSFSIHTTLCKMFLAELSLFCTLCHSQCFRGNW